MAEGYKAWTASEVLDAEDLNDYASSQAVMRFANAAGRDAALNVAIVREGMLAYLKDTNVLTVNTDGTTTGWIQIFPVITASIQDGNVTNAKLAANSVATGNIINGTITGSDIASATISGSNIAGATIAGSNIASGTIGPGNLAGGTYAISITGSAASAATAGSAGSASTAGFASNAALLDNYDTSTITAVNTVAVRDGFGDIQAREFYATGSSQQFASSTTWTYIGLDCARVNNADFVYSYAVSGRTVLVNSNGSLGTSTSSARFKENIEPLPYLPADILKLRPITFRYKADHLEEDADRPVEVGLIAEEVAALGFDELVYRDKEGQPEGIAYEKLAVLLVKVCQDQQTQLDALSARLDKIGG